MDDHESASKLEDVERRIGEVEAALARTVAFMEHLDGPEAGSEYLSEMKSRHEAQLHRLEHRREMLLNDGPESE